MPMAFSASCYFFKLECPDDRFYLFHTASLWNIDALVRVSMEAYIIGA
jgi:hypothetical protein